MGKNDNVRISNELKNPSEGGTYYRLLCMTGASKGKVYYLLGKRIVIGRGDDADIQIIDLKMSREHAELSFADNDYTITDLSTQNGIIVNDAKVRQKKLVDAEKIVVGQTVFKYKIIKVASKEIILGVGGDEIFNAKDLSGQGKDKSHLKTNGSLENDSRNNITLGGSSKRIVFFIAIVGVGYFLFSNNGKAPAPIAEEEKNNNINDFDKDVAISSVNKKDNQVDLETKKKLEQYIHSGRREFGVGNYFRAMEDFRLALLLSPNDGHASFYLSRAKQSWDDDIRKNFIKGKQEHESKKFQAAIVSYCGVLQLMQNAPNDERYKNAMLRISAVEFELGLRKGEIKCFEEKSADSGN